MNLPQSKFRTCLNGHPPYQTFFCPECAKSALSNPEYESFIYDLSWMTQRIREVFISPTIGDMSITGIIDHCMSLPESIKFLSKYPIGTVAYNLNRIHVFQAIKVGMNAWIDESSIPVTQNTEANENGNAS